MVQLHHVLDTLTHKKFPPRPKGEISLVVVYHESQERVARDLYGMLDAVKKLLEADLGRM